MTDQPDQRRLSTWLMSESFQHNKSVIDPGLLELAGKELEERIEAWNNTNFEPKHFRLPDARR